MGTVQGVGGSRDPWYHEISNLEKIKKDLLELKELAVKTDDASKEKFQELDAKVKNKIEEYLKSSPPSTIHALLVSLPIEINNLAKLSNDTSLPEKRKMELQEKNLEIINKHLEELSK